METNARRPAPHLRPAESATGRLAVVLGVGLAAFGLLGFVATGFAPLFGGGGTLAALHLDPLQNLLHLLIGAQLAGAARSGAAARPLPWLLAASGSALPLALPSAHLVVTVLPQLAVTALALTVAARSHRHRSPVHPKMRYNSLQGPSS